MPPENTPTPDVEDDETAPVDIADKPREPTIYEQRLRRESAKYRKQARDLEASIEALKAQTKTDQEAALAALRGEYDQRLVRAELKSAALAAGMIDPDGLRMLDTSKVKLNEDGSVLIPDGFFDAAKTAKPFLFKLTGADTGNTSGTNTPPTAQNTSKTAKDMTEAEFSSAMAKYNVRL